MSQVRLINPEPPEIIGGSTSPAEVQPGETFEDFIGRMASGDVKAKYKIEIMYSSHRSSLLHVHSPLMLLLWESGKRYHGGGDERMFWCGYDDCDAIVSADNFAFIHMVCPKCQREQFLDEATKQRHVGMIRHQGGTATDYAKMPCIAGEKLFRLTPEKQAELLEKVWRQLGGDADVYLKYSPEEIRYDPLHEDTKAIDQLDKVRIQRQPLIYTLKNIMKDLHAGADLKGRFLALVTD